MKTLPAFLTRRLTPVLVSIAIGLPAGPSAAQTTNPRQFVPGELLIGFKSASAKDAAVEELAKAEREGGMRTRSGGQSDTVKIEPLSDRAIMLKLDFVTKKRSKPSQKEELDFLLEKAEEFKESDDGVRYVHPNWIQTVDPGKSVPLDTNKLKLRRQSSPKGIGPQPNDLVYQLGLHWHYMPPPRGMNAIAAWQQKDNAGRRAHGDRKTVVAVVDSGILFNHPDLKGSANVLKGYDFISDPDTARDGNGRDPDATYEGTWCPENPEFGQAASPNSWHGSHVAGTIGATTNNEVPIAGVNWLVSILPVRAMGKCGSGSILDVADAIRWAAGLPVPGIPIKPTPAHIINLSLGGQSPCTWDFAGYERGSILRAREAGAVVAAGNSSEDLANYTPASCEGVISVTASDSQGQLTNYSNFGAATIMAPGGDLNTDSDNDEYSDGVWSSANVEEDNPAGVSAYEGTSMAAPHVSAAIALAMATNKHLKENPDLVERALKETAAKLESGQCPESRPCGVGQLDALKLLQYKLKN